MKHRTKTAALTLLLAATACTIWATTHHARPTAPPETPTRAATALPAGTAAGALAQHGLTTQNGHIDAAAIQALLARTPTSPGNGMATYDRDAYGTPWADTDHNGCDQRNDILTRDLTHRTYRPGTHHCIVLTGTLHDPYTGTTIPFTRGRTTSTAVQIDHIVPLGWAWRHGASTWNATKRERLATDPAELQAVDGPTNESKGDDGPATWLPPNPAYTCTYAARFTAITHRYDLTIDRPDKTALTHALNTCPKQK